MRSQSAPSLGKVDLFMRRWRINVSDSIIARKVTKVISPVASSCLLSRMLPGTPWQTRNEAASHWITRDKHMENVGAHVLFLRVPSCGADAQPIGKCTKVELIHYVIFLWLVDSAARTTHMANQSMHFATSVTQAPEKITGRDQDTGYTSYLQN